MKYETIDELIGGIQKEGYVKCYLKNKDLSYCDLSNLDLSKVPAYVWKDAIFYYTNFSGTNIKFYPHHLKSYNAYSWDDSSRYIYYKMQGCNFSNCDLSYLKSSAFMKIDYNIVDVQFKDCNFSNTNLQIHLPSNNVCWSYNFQNVVLSSEMCKQSKEYWENQSMDMSTLLKNPSLQVSSNKLFSVIKEYLSKESIVLTSKQIEEHLNNIHIVLQMDKEGYLQELYNKLVPYFSLPIEHLHFFQGIVNDIIFKDFDFGELPTKLLNEIVFENCKFGKVSIGTRLKDFSMEAKGNAMFGEGTSLESIYFADMSLSSWKDITWERFYYSSITCRKNLYVELGRACNAKCAFCRNQYLPSCNFDFEKIKEQLIFITPYMNSIVLGGGEPTLNIKMLEDIIHLDVDLDKFSIFTNGTSSFEEIRELSNPAHYKRFSNFNVSHHHYDSEKNAEIFHLSKEKIWSDSDLERLHNYNNVTMCATCFQGGLDTPDDLIEYICYVEQIKGKNILFQSLHEDLNEENIKKVKPLDKEVFSNTIKILSSQGFVQSKPIYSSGDYYLYLLTKNDMTISFKQYITEEELKKCWYLAEKRTFDLSMDPSGRIYQNWHQSYDEVDMTSIVENDISRSLKK